MRAGNVSPDTALELLNDQVTAESIDWRIARSAPRQCLMTGPVLIGGARVVDDGNVTQHARRTDERFPTASAHSDIRAL